MKHILYILMALLMVSSVFAVSRSISGTTVTYAKTLIPTTILKGYWVVEDTLSGCTLNSVTCGSSSYYGCSYVGGSIRVVGHSDDSGANMPTSVTVTVNGIGSCTLTGNYAEGWKTISGVTSGAVTSMGSGTLVLSADCTSLRSSALSAITSWAITPTSTTRTAALNAIVAWATC